MCTYTTRRPKLQIAEEDIVVYKYGDFIVNPDSGEIVAFESNTYCFRYKKEKIYKTILDDFIEVYSTDYKKGFISRRGFYSYKDLFTEKVNAKFVIPKVNAKFIIPKGSKYYLVEGVDFYSSKIIYIYHSDKIKFVEKI